MIDVACPGEWDLPMLKLELGDLKGIGFDLALTGFDAGELDGLLASLTIDPPEEFKEIDETLATEHSCPRSGRADLRHQAFVTYCFRTVVADEGAAVDQRPDIRNERATPFARLYKSCRRP